MITGSDERDLNAKDKFDADRSPFRKLIFFFHTDKEAIDFAEKYNAYSGLTDLDEKEREDASVAEPHLDDMVAYVIIPNIRACDIQDMLQGIEKISAMANLPGFSLYIDAANNDPVSFDDIIDDLGEIDVDVIPEVVTALVDEEAEDDNVIPVFSG